MDRLLAENDALRKELDALQVERQSAVVEITTLLNDLDTIRRDVRHLIAERARLAREVNGLRQQQSELSTTVPSPGSHVPRSLRVPTPNRGPSLSPSVDVDLAPAAILGKHAFALGDTTDEEEAAFEAFFGAVDDRSAKERAWMLAE